MSESSTGADYLLRARRFRSTRPRACVLSRTGVVGVCYPHIHFDHRRSTGVSYLTSEKNPSSSTKKTSSPANVRRVMTPPARRVHPHRFHRQDLRSQDARPFQTPPRPRYARQSPHTHARAHIRKQKRKLPPTAAPRPRQPIAAFVRGRGDRDIPRANPVTAQRPCSMRTAARPWVHLTCKHPFLLPAA